MDEKLFRVLTSSETDTAKQKYIEEIVNYGQYCRSKAEFERVIRRCVDFIATTQSPFIWDSCLSVFREWTSKNMQMSIVIFSTSFVNEMLQINFRFAEDAVLLLNIVLTSVKDGSSQLYYDICVFIQLQIVTFIHTNDEAPSAVMQLCSMLIENPECIPVNSSLLEFCVHLLNSVNRWSGLDTRTEEYYKFRNNMERCVCRLFQYIWQRNSEAALCSVRAVFDIIYKSPVPSVALGLIVQWLPQNIMAVEIGNVVHNSSSDVQFVPKALCCLTDWLMLPNVESVQMWLLLFIKKLNHHRKFSVLKEFAESNTVQMFACLKDGNLREQCFPVVAHVLLGYQSSSHLFKMVLPLVPEVISQLKQEASSGNGSASRCLSRLVELVYCLMYCHSDIRDSFGPTISVLRGFNKPAEADMRERLRQYAWYSHVGSDGNESMHGEIPEELSQSWEDLFMLDARSPTGLTGLTNLGNTCYMNSVLQCLYMCDSFRREALTSSPASSQTIFNGLQRVFAFLALSKRPACSPEQFFKDARPPWFKADMQHDCSEFLRHLLDQMHEQEMTIRPAPAAVSSVLQTEDDKTLRKKSSSSARTLRKLFRPSAAKKSAAISAETQQLSSTSAQHGTSSKQLPTLIESLFGGTIVSTCVCLKCHGESSTSESFTDLTLAFPDNTAGAAAAAATTTSNDTGKKLLSSDAQPESRVLSGGRSEHQMEPVQNGGSTTGGGACSSSKSIQLQAMFDQFLKTESLVGTNRYRCSTCKELQDGERRVQIATAPAHLILTLLRFAYDPRSNRNAKICTDVYYPLTLFIPVTSSISQTATKKKSGTGKQANVQLVQYGLTGVIVHSGVSSEGGHYYCYARYGHTKGSKLGTFARRRSVSSESSVMGDDNDSFVDEWFVFNDERVASASFADIRNLTLSYPKDTAYVLFYKRVDGSDGKPVSNQPYTVDASTLHDDLKAAVYEDNVHYEKSLENKERKKKAVGLDQTSVSSASWYGARGARQSNGGDAGQHHNRGGGGGGGGYDYRYASSVVR